MVSWLIIIFSLARVGFQRAKRTEMERTRQPVSVLLTSWDIRWPLRGEGVHDDRIPHTFQHFRVGENALFWSLRSCMDSDGHPVLSSGNPFPYNFGGSNHLSPSPPARTTNSHLCEREPSWRWALHQAYGHAEDKSLLLPSFQPSNIKSCNKTHSLKPNICKDAQKAPGYRISPSSQCVLWKGHVGFLRICRQQSPTRARPLPTPQLFLRSQEAK